MLRAGDHFYAGLSARTNEEGARQLIHFLTKYGYTGSMVKVDKMLHLKSGLAYLEKNLLLAAGEFIGHPTFADFITIPVDLKDAYAAMRKISSL